MANDREETKKNFERFVAKNTNDSKGKRKPNKQARPAEVRQPSTENKEIADLKRQVRALKAHTAQQDTERENQRKVAHNRQDDKAIKEMEHGSDIHPQKNNLFNKTYHLNYINPSTGKKQPYTLHFEVRPASLADQTAISAEVTNLTNRLGKYFEVNNYDLVEAFANFRVLGIKVPKAFKDPQKMYRPDLLEMVYMDFLEWERNFRQYHMD